jgi:hypothetical protein
MFMIRQGDIALLKIETIPVEAKKQEQKEMVVLAYGEISGHMHALCDEKVEVYKETETEYLKIMEDAWLRHGTKEQIKSKQNGDDHSAIKVPTGNYIVIHQREYSPERIRRVVD